MQNGLRQRVQRLEKRSGAGHVRVPIPGHSGQFMRLPATFANFLAETGAEEPGVNLTTEAIEKSSPH